MDEAMIELLQALQANDQKKVEQKALDVLFTRSGEINPVEVDRFEAYAPCHIINPSKGKRGLISYGGRYYFFG